MNFLEAMDIDYGASGKYYHVIDLIVFLLGVNRTQESQNNF